MTDETESKVREWALKRNGAPLEVPDVVELALAIDNDANQRHRESLSRLDGYQEAFTEHCAEAEQRFANCITRDEAVRLISAEHSTRHDAHMQAYHPPRRFDDPRDADFRGRRRGAEAEELATWVQRLQTFAGGVVGKLLMFAAGAALTLLVSWLATGIP